MFAMGVSMTLKLQEGLNELIQDYLSGDTMIVTRWKDLPQNNDGKPYRRGFRPQWYRKRVKRPTKITNYDRTVTYLLLNVVANLDNVSFAKRLQSMLNAWTAEQDTDTRSFEKCGEENVK